MTMDQFVSKCHKDWHSKNSSLNDNSPSKILDEGYWQIAYHIKSADKLASLSDLKVKVEQAKQRYTGWAAWWVPTREGIKPKPDGDEIVVWLGGDTESSFMDSAHADYWRISCDGRAFLIRGYEEDGLDYDEKNAQKNKSVKKDFDISFPIWRVGECLMHAHKMAELFQCPDSEIEFHITWNGLGGRKLTSWDPMKRRFHIEGNCEAITPRFTKRFIVSASDISIFLPEIIHRELTPLYEQFSFFSLPKMFVIKELESMRNIRF